MEYVNNKIEIRGDNLEEKKIKYSKNKWKNIIDTTEMNYSNMIKRLTRKNKFSNFILIYYSIFLIVNTLTCKYFGEYYNSVVSEYSSVILSIVLLAYSIENSNANYNTRISNIENSLNQIKNLKREIEEKDIKDIREVYNKVTDKTERREDVDFFYTVIQLSKSFDISWFTKKKSRKSIVELSKEDRYEEDVIKGYLSEIFVTKELIKIFIKYIWNLIILLIPIIIMITCYKFR